MLRSFFERTTSPKVLGADRSERYLASGAPVRTLNPDNLDLPGDVTEK